MVLQRLSQIEKAILTCQANRPIATAPQFALEKVPLHTPHGPLVNDKSSSRTRYPYA